MEELDSLSADTLCDQTVAAALAAFEERQRQHVMSTVAVARKEARSGCFAYAAWGLSS